MKQSQSFVFLPLLLALYCSATADDVRLPIVPPITVGEKTFILETFFNTSWYRAGQFCRLHGMHLASINNEAENDKLGETLELFGLHNYTFWTSGNDLDQAMSFVWQSTGNSFTFTNWRPNEPNNDIRDNQTEHCVTINNLVTYAGWDDYFCDGKFYFICELIKKL